MSLLNWFVRTDQRILDSLQSLNTKADKQMTQVSDLTEAVAKLQGDVNTMTTAVAAEVASLNASIATLQAGANPPDLTALIASVNAIDAAVTAATPVAPAPAAAPSA